MLREQEDGSFTKNEITGADDISGIKIGQPLLGDGSKGEVFTCHEHVIFTR